MRHAKRIAWSMMVSAVIVVPGCVRERIVEVREPEHRMIYVEGGPHPREIVEVIPERPHPHAIWVKGYWEVRHKEWIWVPGHWK